MDESKAEPSAARELAFFFAQMVLVFLLAAACVFAPLVVMVVTSPWLGVAVAIGACWVWGRFGPRPFPGLLSGCLCLWGFAAILGSFIVCLMRAVRGLFA